MFVSPTVRPNTVRCKYPVRMTRRRPAADGPRPRLTEERIVDAAIEIIRDVGYDAVSMRSVAARLDTGQASLYVHVRNKSELDRLIVTRVIRETAVTEPAPTDWRELLAGQVEAWIEAMSRYPGLAQAAFASLPDAPDVLAPSEARLAVLRNLGLDVRQALVSHVLLGIFASGRSLEDHAIARRIADSGMTDDAWWAFAAASADTAPPELPYLREGLALLSADFRAWVSGEAVQVILDGIEVRYLPDSVSPRSPRADGAARAATPGPGSSPRAPR